MGVFSVLDREHTVAAHSYNRWLIPPAALAVHLCIGQAYATSVYKNSLVSHFDASLTSIGFVFSIAIVMLGLSAAVFGTWVDRVGPRRAMFTAASCWGAGFLIGGLGISTGQLWLLYLGYGVIGGIGLGIGYISPVSTLIRWFPDRPGLATGMAIMGFGGGAMVAAPASRELLGFYDGAYDPTDATSLADGGALTGLFVTLGIVYFLIMMIGVANIRVPPPGWKPEGFDPATVAAKPMMTEHDVSAAEAIKTRQFWLLWTVLFCNVTAGIGILEQAAPMIQDFFRDGVGGDSSVTIAAAGGLRRRAVVVQHGRSVRLVEHLRLSRPQTNLLVLPRLGSRDLCPTGPDQGQGRADLTVRARRDDHLHVVRRRLRRPSRPICPICSGVFQVGAIHGRLLTAWAAAGVAGPLIINGFLDRAGGPGTLTADAYRPALFTMVGILVVGFLANLLISPVDARHHTDRGEAKAQAAEERETALETEQDEPATVGIRLVLSWGVVSLMLMYGVYETVVTALNLI